MQNQPVIIKETDETKRSSSHPSENNNADEEEKEAFLSEHKNQNKNEQAKNSNPDSKHQKDVKRKLSREEKKNKQQQQQHGSGNKERSSNSNTDRPDLYIELEELHHKKDGLFYNSTGELSEHQWRIVSRWIKYEQTIDPETNMWSKPYVGALIYQNLAYLKTAFQTGTVILDSQDSTTFEGLMDEVITDIISRGHMNRDHREALKAIILSQHRSRSTLAGTITKKAAPLSELFSSDGKHAKMFTSSSSNTQVNAVNPPPSSQHEAGLMGSSFFNKFHHVSRRKSFLLGKINDDNNNHADRNSSEEKKHSPVRIYLNEAHGSSSKRLSIANNLFHLHHHSKPTTESTRNGVEAFLIMVGPLDFLDRTIMAFVRLTDEQIIDHLAEYNIRVRFLFLFFGPDRPNIDYHEIGRCMGTLMINREFHDCAYSTKTRAELLKAITTFTNRNLCLVLPIGEYDEDILNPAMNWIRKMVNKKMAKVSQGNNTNAEDGKKDRKKKHSSATTGKEVARMSEVKEVAAGDKRLKKKKSIFDDLEEGKEFDPFKRTGCPFGSLIKEVEYRYSKYFSDIYDGLNLHCFIATIFGFTVCVAPALCFGGILADKTDQTFGVNEMLLATSINGVVYALLSGQPLMIFGATGPFLVFEEMLYKLCQKLCIDFLASRIWVSAWVLIFTLGLLATESVHIIHNVTRFTEEIFAFLIACVFLTDAIKKIIYYFQHDPIYNVVKYCDMRKDNLTTTISYYYHNTTSYIETNVTSSSMNLFSRCAGASASVHKQKHTPEPNIALISLLLLIGTCFLALSLKKLRRSNFFGSYIRRTLSDVGILISIMLMVFVDLFIRRTSDINTQKLDIPSELLPTKHRSWFVSPVGNLESFHFWHPLISILPAFIIFIVLFFEVELTGIMLTAKHRKVKKGTGFNLDLLLGALMMTVNSFFGLPWMCAAPVRTLAHWASLTVYSTSLIPGEKPKLSEVKEQRLTSFSIHILIFLCLQAKTLLRVIPVPVLFGVFLYFGIVSLSGTQLFERMGFMFVPFKYCPNLPHAVGIRPSKRNLFTILQIIGVAVLLAFKSVVSLSFLFPIVLVLLVPFRKFALPKFFTHRELEVLDDENESMEDDMAHDFYELTHLPI